MCNWQDLWPLLSTILCDYLYYGSFSRNIYILAVNILTLSHHLIDYQIRSNLQHRCQAYVKQWAIINWDAGCYIQPLQCHCGCRWEWTFSYGWSLSHVYHLNLKDWAHLSKLLTVMRSYTVCCSIPSLRSSKGWKPCLITIKRVAEIGNSDLLRISYCEEICLVAIRVHWQLLPWILSRWPGEDST